MLKEPLPIERQGVALLVQAAAKAELVGGGAHGVKTGIGEAEVGGQGRIGEEAQSAFLIAERKVSSGSLRKATS